MIDAVVTGADRGLGLAIARAWPRSLDLLRESAGTRYDRRADRKQRRFNLSDGNRPIRSG